MYDNEEKEILTVISQTYPLAFIFIFIYINHVFIKVSETNFLVTSSYFLDNKRFID